MNVWLIAALVLLVGFVPCLVVLWREPVADALVALNLGGTLATLEIVLLAEGFRRPELFDLALALALLSFAGGLVFARFLERWV